MSDYDLAFQQAPAETRQLWSSVLSATAFQCCHGLQGIRCFLAKIGIANTSSLRLFEKLGYAEVSRSNVFNEATLRLEVFGHVSKAVLQQAENLRIESYDNS